MAEQIPGLDQIQNPLIREAITELFGKPTPEALRCLQLANRIRQYLQQLAPGRFEGVHDYLDLISESAAAELAGDPVPENWNAIWKARADAALAKIHAEKVLVFR